PLAPPTPVDPAVVIKRDLDKLQGTWYVVASQNKGKEQVVTTPLKVVVVGQSMTIHHPENSGGPETSFLKVDPNVNPHKIDIFPPKPGHQDAGIYRWQGDNIQICLGARLKVADGGKVIADAEKQRPRAFDSRDGWLLLLSRTAPK